MSGKVSIVMPSYNTGAYIADSIRSVINQTYQDWELLIVDDCSDDNTDEVVTLFHDIRIRYIKNLKNSGTAVSRNRALREAKGKWIAFLDSDDLWMPEKLEKQIRFMEMNNYHFSYTKYSEINPDGSLNGTKVTGPERINQSGFLNYCWPGCLTVMYDADYIGVVQIADIRKNNDYAMWLKICKSADCYLIDEDLALYRKGRGGSVSTQSAATMIRWHYKLFRYAEHRNPVVSFLLVMRNLIYGCIKKLCYTERDRTLIKSREKV